MDSRVKVKQTEPATVAYAMLKGSYSESAGALKKLYAWMQAKGYVPVGPPVGVFSSTQAALGEDRLAGEVRCPIAGASYPEEPDEDGLGVKVVPGDFVAAAVHRGPLERLGETYDLLATWVAQNGYVIAGPPEEVYYSDVSKVSSQGLVTEVRFPVRRKAAGPAVAKEGLSARPGR